MATEDKKLANQDKKLKSIIITCLPNDVMKALEGENVNGTFTKLKCLLNDLENKGITIPQAKLMPHLLTAYQKWLSMNQTQRANNSIKNDRLTTVYGKYSSEEASVCGEFLRLEPLALQNIMWQRKTDWFLLVSDSIIEVVCVVQKFPDGGTYEVMVLHPRSNMHINLPALKKSDAMLISMLDSKVFNQAGRKVVVIVSTSSFQGIIIGCNKKVAEMVTSHILKAALAIYVTPPKWVAAKYDVPGALLHNITTEDTRERPLNVSFEK
nr:Rop guanine nucleotide exchange factor 1 [Tanacetum cinerariifolium]